MHRLRLFAITIDDVRDIFGADPEMAAELRTRAARHFMPPRDDRSLLGSIGPLRFRHRRTEVDPRRPLAADVEAMLSGGHIPTERLPQCWELLLVWLDALSARHVDMQIDEPEAVDFELARAGLPSTHSMGSLSGRPLGVSLRPLPSQTVGYSKHGHVVEVSRLLRRVHDSAGEEFAATMARIEPPLSLLEDIARHREAPLDLVVIQVPA